MLSTTSLLLLSVCFGGALQDTSSAKCPQSSGDCLLHRSFDSMRNPNPNPTNRMVFRLRNDSRALDGRRPLVSERRSSNSDHLLDEPSSDENRAHETSAAQSALRMRPLAAVTNTNRYRERNRKRMRAQMTTTSTTTTTTSTTTPAPIDDYYEYDDYYDDYSEDYRLTTTTTTTTTTRSPKRRRGRRRFRRPTEAPTTTTTTTLSPNYKPRPDGRVIDYSADPNFPYELKGADLTEYPFFISIPENKFECKGRHDGYYANVALWCQVYHHCAIGHQRYDFLCPNYTLFDQTTFTCRFINTVDCVNSENHYNRNDELYVESTTTVATAATHVTHATALSARTNATLI